MGLLFKRCRCSQAVLALIPAEEDAGGEVRRAEAVVLGVAAQLGKGVSLDKRALQRFPPSPPCWWNGYLTTLSPPPPPASGLCLPLWPVEVGRRDYR